MKKVFVILVILTIVFCRCGSVGSNNTENAYETEFHNAELASQNSVKTVDSFFSGYRFGMTSDQLMKHTQKLVDEGTMKVSARSTFYYEFPPMYGDPYKGYLFNEYFDGKLYSLGLAFTDETSPLIVFSKLSDLYEKKYGSPNYILKPLKDQDIYEKYWFIDNLKIKLKSGIVQTTVQYIDMKVQRKKEIADSLEIVNKENKTIKGI